MWPLLHVLLAWTFGPPLLPLLLPLVLLPPLPLWLVLQLPTWLSPLLLLLNNVILNNVNLIDPHLLCMFICMAAFVGRIDRNLRKLMRRLDIKE